MIDLTVIIPAYNESLGIGQMLEELVPIAQKNNWKVLVVNDGSSDETINIVSQFDFVEAISHQHNKGYGAALKTGILHANSEYIAMYDADGQHNPKDLEMLAATIDELDMNIGSRGKDSHHDIWRKPGKKVLSMVANFLAETKIPDINSGLRVVKRNIIVNLLHLFPNGFSFSTTSTIAFLNLGYNVKFHPIKVRKRVGKSTVRQFKHGTETIMLMLRLIMLFSPMKIFGRVSFWLLILGIAEGIVDGIILNDSGIDITDTSLFFIQTSVLIFFFGLVADQISEVRKNQSINFQQKTPQ